MSLTITPLGPRTIELHVRGKLDEGDYARFVPQAARRIDEHGGINLIVHLANLEGWTPKALWEDLKFDAKHYGDVNRLALVGEDDSKDWLATISKPLTGADVKFFTTDELAAARTWASAARTETAAA